MGLLKPICELILPKRYAQRLPILAWAHVKQIRDGRVIYETHDHNTLHDDGCEYILSACWVTGLSNFGAPGSNVYLGLDNRSSIGQTDTLASLLNENALSTYGYSRQALSTAGTGASGQDFVVTKATYYQAASKTITWTDTTTNWVQTVKCLFLATDATATSDAAGKHLICSIALTHGTVTMLVGDQLQATITINFSG